MVAVKKPVQGHPRATHKKEEGAPTEPPPLPTAGSTHSYRPLARNVGLHCKDVDPGAHPTTKLVQAWRCGGGGGVTRAPAETPEGNGTRGDEGLGV